ncbi:MAG TPA: DoxX family protein [Burkholderiaceae bacterium]
MALGQAFFAMWTPRAQGLLRLIASFLFLQHATAKFFAVPHVAMFDNLQVLSLVGIAGIIELVCGALLLIGLWGRPAAFVLSGEMAVAYFMAHAPHGNVLSPLLNSGEPAVLYCFVFLFLSVAGPGSWSVDAARGVVKA